MGNLPNPALLIGLQLTAVSSICFCLQRALKSHSLQQRKKQITSYTKRVENSHNSCGKAAHSHLLWRLLISASLLQAPPAVCWCLLAKGKAGEAAGALQMGGGPSCHLQRAVRCKPQLRHCACLIPLSLGLSGVSSIDTQNTEEESDNRTRHEFHHWGEGKAAHCRLQGLFQ